LLQTDKIMIEFLNSLEALELVQVCWMIFITIGIIKIAWTQDSHGDKIDKLNKE